MIKLLKAIGVIREVPNRGRNPKLGKGFTTATRLDPYNPLSYITIVVVLLLALILFGIKGMWRQLDIRNPFKWR